MMNSVILFNRAKKDAELVSMIENLSQQPSKIQDLQCQILKSENFMNEMKTTFFEQ